MHLSGGRAVRSLFLVLCLCAVVSGCSTTPYQDGTGDLDKGLAATQSSLTAMDSRDQAARAILDYQSVSKMTLSSCGVRPKNTKLNCVLLIDGKPATESSAFPNTLLLAGALADYGKALDDLATAKDLSDVNSKIADINKSAEAVAKGVGIALPGYVAPAADLAAYLFGQYEEYKRSQLIRGILLAYGGTFDSAIGILEQQAVTLQLRIVGNEKQIVRTEIEKLDLSVHEAERLRLISDIMTRQAQLQAFANQDASKPFTALKIANSKLVDIARNPQISFSDVVTAISDFYQKAKALDDALKPSPAKSTGSKKS
jgi:hypothetical protein